MVKRSADPPRNELSSLGECLFAMCIALLLVGQDPDIPLIISSNRDEFFQRRTKRLHRWDEPLDCIIGGRDLERSGTWLGEVSLCLIGARRRGIQARFYR